MTDNYAFLHNTKIMLEVFYNENFVGIVHNINNLMIWLYFCFQTILSEYIL